MEWKVPMEKGNLLCRDSGDRVEFIMGRTQDTPGLYKGFLLGEKSRMELGTMIPEGRGLCLRRTVSVETLKKRGCWPVTGGEAVLVYPFGGEGLPPGWQRENCPARWFDPASVLHRQAEGLTGCLCRNGEQETVLAVPFSTKAPFPLPAAFCFAKPEELSGRWYVLYRFAPGGVPRLPGE